MHHIGHIVFAREALMEKNHKKFALIEPFSVLEVPIFPHKESFFVNIGLFNLESNSKYNFSYFIYSPTGEKREAKFMDFTASPKNENKDSPIHITLNLGLEDIEFEEEGVYRFDFVIGNLNQSKINFFYVKKEDIHGTSS